MKKSVASLSDSCFNARSCEAASVGEEVKLGVFKTVCYG